MLFFSTVKMKASLALVICLSLTFTHGADKARMNRAVHKRIPRNHDRPYEA